MVLPKYYLVYVCTAKRKSDNVVVKYFGMTGVLPAQSDTQAANVRKRYLIARPVFALRKCKDHKISVIGSGYTKKVALIEEARETAKAWVEEQCNERVRGAAWCRNHLTSLDKKTLQEVSQAASRAGVIRIAEDHPNHVLQKHLNMENYADAVGDLNDLTAHLVSQPPLAISQPKRQSGRNHKSGRSNWVRWRGDARPGSRKWPSNFKGFPEWKRRQPP